jgi:hypothetical protein
MANYGMRQDCVSVFSDQEEIRMCTQEWMQFSDRMRPEGLSESFLKLETRKGSYSLSADQKQTELEFGSELWT